MWLAAALWACTDKEGPPTETGGPPAAHTGATTETEPSTGSGATVAPLSFASAPVLRDNPDAGLTAWVDATLSREGWLELEVEIDGRAWTVSSEPGTTLSHLLLGLRPDADLTVTVTGRADDGGSTAPVVLADRTDPLPPNLYRRSVVVRDEARMEPGVTLLGESEWIVMLDADGVPCWYRQAAFANQDVDLLPGNRIGVIGPRNRFDVLDLSGAVVQRIVTSDFVGPAIPEAHLTTALAIHHDALELPNGNLLTLSVEARTIPFPPRETFPGPPVESHVAGEIVVEIAPDGTVVQEWKLHDLMDPLRIGYDSVRGDYWDVWGPFRGGDFTSDWLHANALDYDPATDTVLVSMRHQDALLAFSRGTGEIRWIAAPPVNWQPAWAPFVLAPPADPTALFYHQHQASFTPRGTVILFDNGNRRASAYETPLPDDQVASRAMEIAIDEATGTWEVVWQWGFDVPEPEFAGSLGGVTELPVTGNHLVTFGNLGSEPGVYSRVVEVAPDDAVVWQLDLLDDRAWFRSRRLTGVIPGPGR